MEFKTHGIVLKKLNFSEADRILRIFTKEFGLLSAVAKGVKKTTSRKSGCLEIFCESDFRLHRRRGELFTISEASLIQAFESKNLEETKVAYEVGELLLHLSPFEKPLPRIYKLTQEFLATISQTHKLKLLKLAYFAKVLSIFGFLEDVENFEMKQRKLFKFLLESSFEEILKLREEKEVFVKVENYLNEILESVSEKKSKVIPSTQSWS